MSDENLRGALDEREASVEEFTPIRLTRRARTVHATSLLRAFETACGEKISDGAIVVARRLTCKDCKLAVGLDCRRPGP